MTSKISFVTFNSKIAPKTGGSKFKWFIECEAWVTIVSNTLRDSKKESCKDTK